MTINLEFAKRLAAEKVVKMALSYIEKDPDRNFIKVLDLLEKIARTDMHQQYINTIREEYNKNPVIKQYINKFNEIAPSYKEGLVMNFFINSGLLGIPYQQKMSEKLNTGVPWAILMDPTSACNLNCKGCWAGKYSKSDTLEFETLDRIVREAKELGIYFFVLSGGEPTIYPYLFDLCKNHQDAGFLMFTNGTLIDEEMVGKMVEAGNLTPAISIEGFKEATDARRGAGVYAKIMNAMDLLRENGVVFGASVTVTRNNVEELFAGDDFIDLMVEKGATYVWSFHYIPIGSDPDLDMMITPEQRKMLAYRVPELRSKKPVFLVDFWNDGTFSGGCIAGGRRYFHINAKGEVEPCAFVHFAVDNIKNKSLKEVLQNPLFESYQKRQPFNDNLMAPCPIIDNPQALRDIVQESRAKPTHVGADTVLKGRVGEELDKLSARWHKVSQPIHDQRMGEGGEEIEKAQ